MRSFSQGNNYKIFENETIEEIFLRQFKGFPEKIHQGTYFPKSIKYVLSFFFFFWSTKCRPFYIGLKIFWVLLMTSVLLTFLMTSVYLICVTRQYTCTRALIHYWNPNCGDRVFPWKIHFTRLSKICQYCIFESAKIGPFLP